MIIKTMLSYFWKLPLCGAGFLTGMVLSAVILFALGFQSPEMPAGTDASTVAMWFLLGSIVLAYVLSFVSRNLRASWMVRWLILAELTWVFGVIGMVIESFFFMTTGAVASLVSVLFTMLNFLLPSLFLSVLVATLYKAAEPFEPCLNCLRSYFVVRKIPAWMGITILALLAYPLVYFAFGLMVQPFIQEFYVTGQFELTTPTWGQLIPLQLIRSFMFLSVSLPVIVLWRASRRKLWLVLGLSIFALTAFMAVICAYWFPWQMRLFHGLELLADGIVYAGVLVLLFGREQIEVGERSERILGSLTRNSTPKRNRIWNH